MAPEPIPYRLPFPYVEGGPSGFLVDPGEDVDTGVGGFWPIPGLVKLTPRPGDGLPRPVQDLYGPQAAGISVDEEQLDGGAGQMDHPASGVRVVR